LQALEKLFAHGHISSSQLNKARLEHRKAEFALREARTKLEVLQKDTQEKRKRELLTRIEAAMIAEADQEAALKLQEQRQALLARQAEAAPARPVQDRVVELLDEGLALQARVVAALRKIRRLQEPAAEAEPVDARRHDRIRELRDEVERLGAASQSKLADALGLAEAQVVGAARGGEGVEENPGATDGSRTSGSGSCPASSSRAVIRARRYACSSESCSQGVPAGRPASSPSSGSAGGGASSSLGSG
jgi:hypothetical protein